MLLEHKDPYRVQYVSYPYVEDSYSCFLIGSGRATLHGVWNEQGAFLCY
jgi:hypothetical protein